MKSMIFGVVFIFISAPAIAQAWETDLNKAFREAEAQNKNVLLFFSVADACETCRRLDNNVFQSEEFLAYAKENLVLVKLDFGNTSNTNDKAEQLLVVEKYNKDGFFPWVVLINKNEHIVGKASLYEGQSAAKYVNDLKSLDK
jgi:thioredoxin-related protein